MGRLLLGILLRGAVVVPMDSAASPDFVQRAIKDAGVKLILRDRQQMELPGAHRRWSLISRMPWQAFIGPHIPS